MLDHLHMYTTFCFVYVCVWRYFKMSCVTDPCVRFKIWRSLPEGPKNWMPSVDGSVAGSTWTVFSWSWVSSGRCAWSWSWWSWWSCEWSCGWSCGWLWITSPCICTWSCGTCVGGGLTSSPTDIRCSIPWTMKKKTSSLEYQQYRYCTRMLGLFYEDYAFQVDIHVLKIGNLYYKRVLSLWNGIFCGLQFPFHDTYCYRYDISCRSQTVCWPW